MPKPIPIYTDHDEQYRADSCRPLLDAAASQAIQFEALRHGHYPGRALPSGVLTSVKMLGYWDASRDQPWGLSWHRNEGLEITFLETGRLPFEVDQKEFTLKANDITITRPWQLHRVGRPGVTASRLHWLIMDLGIRRPDQAWKWPSWVMLTPSDLEELTNFLRLNEQPVWTASADLRRCFQSIAHIVGDDGGGRHLSRLTVRLNELFMLLLEVLRSGRVHLDQSLTSTRRTVQLFLDDLRAHPENLSREWQVEEMARSCGLGVSQFSQHVRCLVNMSPVQFLTRCRIDRAVAVLNSRPHASITDIALECGFSSSQYFATTFKRWTGHSPRVERSKPPSPAVRSAHSDPRNRF